MHNSPTQHFWSESLHTELNTYYLGFLLPVIRPIPKIQIKLWFNFQFLKASGKFKNTFIDFQLTDC